MKTFRQFMVETQQLNELDREATIGAALLSRITPELLKKIASGASRLALGRLVTGDSRKEDKKKK